MRYDGDTAARVGGLEGWDEISRYQTEEGRVRVSWNFNYSPTIPSTHAWSFSRVHRADRQVDKG